MNTSRKIAHSIFNKLKLVRLRFPTELEFEPIQVCNAKCFTCPYTTLSEDPDYTKQKMTRDQVENLLSQFGELLKKHKYTGDTRINPYRYSDPLITKNLDVVLSTARKYGMRVAITTNAKGFNSRTIPLLEEYIDNLTDNISISILGSTQEEVMTNMKVDLSRTIKILTELADKKSILVKKINVSLRIIEGTQQERKNLAVLAAKLNKLGYSHHIKSDWIHNRVDGEKTQQSQDNFVKGCNLWHNKLLRRLEVMVNGNVVLCDDDAEGRRIFGNVFKESIESIWNGTLLEEHSKIFATKYSEDKESLICTHCSRAEYKKRKYNALHSIKDIGVGPFLKQAALRNVKTV